MVLVPAPVLVLGRAGLGLAGVLLMMVQTLEVRWSWMSGPVMGVVGSRFKVMDLVLAGGMSLGFACAGVFYCNDLKGQGSARYLPLVQSATGRCKCCPNLEMEISKFSWYAYGMGKVVDCQSLSSEHSLIAAAVTFALRPHYLGATACTRATIVPSCRTSR